MGALIVDARLKASIFIFFAEEIIVFSNRFIQEFSDGKLKYN
jgi:hypothetical protein